MTAQNTIIKPIDLKAVRSAFPILKQTVYGKRLAFLDSAASSQRPDTVIAAEKDLYEGYYANIHRGVYQFSQRATEAYEATREAVRSFIGAAEARECLFVRGATEGINLVAQTWGRQTVQDGDEILLTELEHHSNIVPWQMLAAEKGAVIKVVPVLDDGQLDLEAFHALLSKRTKMLAVGHISNAIGTINPVKDMIDAAHAVGAVVLIDGCQAPPHLKLDMQALDADFYVFSGHKMYGPSGIGVLYGKEELLDAMPPWQGGGDMIEQVRFEGTTWNTLPYKFEAGTPNIAGGIALKPAIDFIEGLGQDAMSAHEMDVANYARSCLSTLNSVRIIGEGPHVGSVISFVMEGIHPHDIGTILDRSGIAVRAGHHCAQPLMERFNVPGTVRASFNVYNGRDDVDQLMDGLDKVIELFG